MQLTRLVIREATDRDLIDVLHVEKEAFKTDDEAELTRLLLNDETADPVVSLLALYNNKAIGHILFTKVTIAEGNSFPLMHLLAPMAVLPKFQKRGVGGVLIKEGLKILKGLDSELVFVLGHIDYYPRYGFTPDANKLGYTSPFPIPEEVKDAWMVQHLSGKGLSGKKGKIICCNVLNKPEYWRE